MEGGGLCPSMALAMIAEGKEQVIQIDHRTLLQKVMEALGTKQAPLYTIFDCGTNGVKVSIKLDVSSAKYSVGQKINVAVVESGPSQSRMLAEKSAVMKAFKHLNDKHLIKIKDFSSRVAHEVDGNSTFGYVNSAVHTVEKLIDQWEIVMDKCQNIALQIGRKEVAGNIDGDGNEQGDIYGSLNQFMQMMMDVYKGEVAQARSRAKEIECERKKYHSRSTEKYHAGLRKGYLQDVFLQAKEVLDYVLTYLGSGKATYSNGPTDEGMMEGVVMFNIPDIAGIECCGNLTIRGKAMRSRDAEENAAFEALLYMERKYNLKIVDINQAERVDAEKEQSLLVRILEQLLRVGRDVNVYWGKMVKNIATEKKEYPMDPENLYAGPAAAKKTEAYRCCAKWMEELENETTKRYEDCAFRFEELEKLEYKMNEMKTKLEMD